MAITFCVRAAIEEALLILNLLAGLQRVHGRAAGPGLGLGRERSVWLRNDSEKNNVFPWSMGEELYSEDFSSLPSSRMKLQLEGVSSKNGSKEEVEALMAFKQALNVSSRSVLSSWKATDANPCHWKGITCYEPSGRVQSVDLAGLDLAGRISPLLGRLQYLYRLDLSRNSLTGEIPTSILNCTDLAYLLLAENTLTGQIPSQIGVLSQLSTLNLSTNFYLRGRFPSSISNCSLLKRLHLDFTLVEGEIPDTIGQLSKIEVISVRCTLLNGSLPRSLGNCSSLTNLLVGNAYLTYFVNQPQPPSDDTFLLSNTQLGGTLPEEMANLKKLRELVIGGTNIYGPIPSWLANLTSLLSINSPSNLFSGQIPEFFGSLRLRVLDLYGNNFSGIIPPTITNCSGLIFLDLSSLQLGGIIPPDVGLLTKIFYLRVDDNQLVGKIPPSLSNCSLLQGLGLGDNSLDPQPLPEWMGSLVSLEVLYLSSMNLVGKVPVQITRLPLLSLLYLDGNYFYGLIPKQLGNCSILTGLWLGSNDFTGQIPPELWELLQLTELDIQDNKLTGSLSEGIGNLSYLEEVNCQRNLLNGVFPSRLSELSNLNGGYFQENKFDGHIPDAIGNMSALQNLDLSFNHISGSIPASIGNLSGLARLAISGTWLRGAIPTALMSCTQLLYLDLHGNRLIGSIPEEIRDLRVLTELYLQKNQLSGALPGSLGLCSQLVKADFSYNAFQDVLSEEAFGNASSALNSLNLSHNFFSGRLPTALGVLTVVRTLQLSSNSFSGSIPPELGSCLSLEALDLSKNDFTGTIPSTLASLQHLTLLNLSYNELEGPLPSTGIFNSENFSAAWFLGNPRLCGSQLSRNCSTPGAALQCKGLSCRATKLAVIISCVASALLVVTTGVCMAFWFWRAKQINKIQEGVVTFHTGMHLSEQDLLKVMEEPGNLIATGASSSVYRVDLSEGKTIALKVLIRRSHSVGDDLYNEQLGKAKACMYREADILSKLKHRNILKVFGMVSSPRMTSLMLEFMPLGSLDNQLHGAEKCFLEWEQRLNIAAGIAQGLIYLHEEVEVPLVHKDLKPSNVLLDADMTAKLGDFGISRFTNASAGDGEVTATHVCGTFGYIPPEYASNTRVSTRGDVYSYGVILLELVTGRRPNMQTGDQSNTVDSPEGSKHSNPLVDWVLRNSMDLRSWSVVVDPLLVGEGRMNSMSDKHKEQMKLLIQVGLLCTQINPQSRPRMYDVLAMLTYIQRLGEDPVNIPTLAELAVETTDVHSIQPNSRAYLHQDATTAST